MGCCFGTTNSQRNNIPVPPVAPLQEPSSVQNLGKNSSAKRKDPHSLYKEINSQSNKSDNQQVQTNLNNKELSLVHKNKGNEFFKNKQYKPAIKEYTLAIDLYAQDPVYFSNRALCFKFLAQYKEVINDAESSLRLNKINYKAYHLQGVALVELGKSELTTNKVKEGITALETSLSLLQGSDPAVKKDIEVKVGRAKKVLWLKDKEYSENEAVKTAAYVKKLIEKDLLFSKEQRQEMENCFNEFVIQNNKKRFIKEVPESLCCKITFELMKEPNISPSGVTYERETLIEHLNKVGKFDPFTRQPLYQADLIKNNSITKATRDFQTKNPWIFEPVDHDEDYRKIHF